MVIMFWANDKLHQILFFFTGLVRVYGMVKDAPGFLFGDYP
jgi:hypothetical protein